jgi:ABC-2 type transport system permease protein
VLTASRTIFVCWRFYVKWLGRSPFEVADSLLTPVVYATIAITLYGANSGEAALVQAVIGAGLMGVWSVVLFGAGGAIQEERWNGTLELLVSAPVSLSRVLIGYSLATATIGAISLVATMLWGTFALGVELNLARPAMFILASIMTIFSMGAIGFLLATTFVALRNANALANALDFPIWLLCGLLVSLDELPSWVLPISRLLSPTWAAMSLRAAALGGDVLWPLVWSGVLSASYIALALIALRRFDVLSRKNATLALR